MSMRSCRYSNDEAGRRGTEWYESKIRPLAEKGNVGRMLAIDIDTGDYAIADERYDACQVLFGKNPDAQIWTLRIGHVAAERFGGGDTRKKNDHRNRHTIP